MARTALTVRTATSVDAGAISADGAALALTAGDVANGNKFVSSGKDYLLVYNSSTDTDYYVTINSVADDKGRTGDVTQYDVGYGEFALFGPFTRKGWAQTSGADAGSITLDCENAALFVAAIRIPA